MEVGLLSLLIARAAFPCPYAQGRLPQIWPGLFLQLLPVPLHKLHDQRAHGGPIALLLGALEGDGVQQTPG